MAAVTPEEEVVPAPQAAALLPHGPAQSRAQTAAMACAISVAAGIIHAVAMVDHFGHSRLYGAFFLFVTYFQVLWAIWVYRRPGDRRLLLSGAIVSIAICAVWLVSRTTGIPFGPEAWKPERIGAMDIVATLDQLVLASLATTILARDGQLTGGVARRLTWLAGAPAVRLGFMLCSASLFSILLGSHHHH